MQRRVILHVDGSSKQSKRLAVTKLGKMDRPRTIGWGLVALHDNGHHERSGAYRIQRTDSIFGMHEAVAIAEGIEYAYVQGFEPEDVAMYCDDDLLGYSPTYLHSPNQLWRKSDAIVDCMQKVLQYLEPDNEVRLYRTLNYLRCMRMVKLKGHKMEVYQERADYLAGWESEQALYPESSSLSKKPFEQWLYDGFVVYDQQRQAQVKKAAFVDASYADATSFSP